MIISGGLQSYISEVTATGVTSHSAVPSGPGGVLTAAIAPVGDGLGEVSQITSHTFSYDISRPFNSNR